MGAWTWEVSRAGRDSWRGAREGWTGAKGWGSSNLGFMWGRRLKSGVHKTEATSRRASSKSRRAREFIDQRRDVETNVAT